MVQLSIANTQLVEIAKAISYESSLIVMDEPTSAITEAEVANLFNIIRSLKQKGVSVIYITHKMDEVFKICDEVTVLRDGRYVDTSPIQVLTHDLLIRMMVGRELTNMFDKEETPVGDAHPGGEGLLREAVPRRQLPGAPRARSSAWPG